MPKFMRKLPTILAAIFILVQVSGLAQYATDHLGGSEIRGAAMAWALEAGVFACSYWMRQSITRKDGETDARDKWARVAAFVALLVFLAVSAYLNTAKSIADLPAKYTDMDHNSAVLFGLVPTVFAALLGILQGFIDRLPVPPSHKATSGRMMRLAAIVDNVLTLIERRTSGQAAAEDAKHAKQTYKCPQCGASVANLGSHVRWAHGKR